MDVFVYREPKGFETRDLEDIEELGEQLTNYGPLTDDTEVKVEITGPWAKVRELLTHPVNTDLFGDIWFNPKTDPRFRERSKGEQ